MQIQTPRVDCDIHPSVPGMAALTPYMNDFWRDSVEERGIGSLDSNAYPPGAPITARADFRDGVDVPGSIEQVRDLVLDRWNTDLAICNCLYGVQLVFSEDMAAAFASALNAWIAAEWLDRDPRLRASIVVPVQNVDYAVEEIERWAPDCRFVQVLLLVMGEVPLGRRHHWPIYEAAVRHGLPVAVHAGSSYRHPVTSVGWPSYYLEDYVSQAQGFQSQVASLICEGVFAKLPDLKVVLLESGVTWAPGFLWRFSKFWKGLRTEVPWVDRPPIEIFRDNFAMTLQPFDAPPSAEIVEKVIDQIGSEDILLYASDFPHWQFDEDDRFPVGMSETLRQKILSENPKAIYPRLKEQRP